MAALSSPPEPSAPSAPVAAVTTAAVSGGAAAERPARVSWRIKSSVKAATQAAA